MATREFQFSEGSSHKFWRISVEDAGYTVQYGRIGTTGQTQTKEFGSEAEAQKSAEKLIAEKVKKGYVEQGVTAIPAASSTSATPAPTNRVAPPSTPRKSTVSGKPQAPTSSADETGQGEAQIDEAVVTAPKTNPPSSAHVSRSLDLKSEDWQWATWRPRTPRSLPEAPPFDLDEAAARLSKVTTSHYGWTWAWEKARIAPKLTREEAHFWALAMSARPKDFAPKDLARHLIVWGRGSAKDGSEFLKALKALGLPESTSGEVDHSQRAQALKQRGFTGEITLEEITTRVEQQMAHTPGHLIVPLVNLFSVPVVLEWLLARDEEFRNQSWWGNYWSNRSQAFGQGFRTLVLPFLTEAELTQVRDLVRPQVQPHLWSSPRPAAFFFAAITGMHEELRAVVEAWPDDQFGGQYAYYYDRPMEILFGLGEPRLVESHMRRLKLRLHLPEYVGAWLAHTEYGALDVVHDAVATAENKEAAEQLLEAFAAVKAPEAAPHMLELTVSSKAGRPARQWLEAHPEHAVVGLIPTAAGRGKLAELAAEYLRALGRKGAKALIQAALEQAPADVAEKVRSLLEEEGSALDPLDEASTPTWLREALAAATGKKKAAPPQWVSPADLPLIAIGDRCLSQAQVQEVLGALQRDPLGEPGPLLQGLRKHVDRGSLNRFAWRLFELWLADGAVSKEKWAMTALAHLGSDASALKLAPMVRAWPGESQHQRAVLGLECLRAIGSDTALMLINGIAQKVPFKGLKTKAGECMEAIAKDRGFTRPQLEDRIVPTCDLDERGTRTFDFGPRQFRFVLGPGMKPMLREADGKVRPDLPKPNAKDDPALAAQATEEWKLLKKQVGDVVKTQVVRLEQAMVTGRRWPREDFENLLVRHPLMTNLVRLLVWGAYDADGNLAATFRVTEEQSFADQQDEPISLDGYPEVGLVHPLHLSEEDKQAWGELLGDYEIVPPFAQLGRPISSLEPAEKVAEELCRWTNLEIAPQSLVFTLEKLEWQRGIPEDAGIFYSHSKPFYGANVTAVVEYEEGVPVGYMDGWDNQTVTRCFFVPGIWRPEMYPDHKDRVPLASVDPVVISEVLTDLTIVAAKAVQ